MMIIYTIIITEIWKKKKNTLVIVIVVSLRFLGVSVGTDKLERRIRRKWWALESWRREAMRYERWCINNIHLHAKQSNWIWSLFLICRNSGKGSSSLVSYPLLPLISISKFTNSSHVSFLPFPQPQVPPYDHFNL